MGPTNSVLQSFYKTLESEGATLLGAHKADLEEKLHHLSDGAADTLITTTANQIKTQGLGGLVATPLKNALISAEPELNNMINTAEDHAIDALESFLQKAAASVPEPEKPAAA